MSSPRGVRNRTDMIQPGLLYVRFGRLRESELVPRPAPRTRLPDALLRRSSQAYRRRRMVDFGASDMSLKSEELAKLGLGQFPLVIGGVVPVVNIERVELGQLKLTGGVLADIFLGKVQKWNDPALRALNPDLRLPDAPITVVHRSDGSGTTFNWVNYLSKSSAEWRDKVGEATSVEWPIGIGGRGNEGVAVFVG